jgi:probable HAF family extracellular repeat protein
MIGMGDMPGGGFYSQAYAASADGSVIVGFGWSGLGVEAFRWTQQTGMVGLGDLPGGDFESFAAGVSADGRVVTGYSRSASSQYEAFFWTPETGMLNLREYLISKGVNNLAGRQLVIGQRISANGKYIVGVALNPNEGFVAFLGSEPCYADCDSSGSLDIDDFICYQTLFATGDFNADCDGDKHIDIDDFICFQTAFGAGCG